MHRIICLCGVRASAAPARDDDRSIDPPRKIGRPRAGNVPNAHRSQSKGKGWKGWASMADKRNHLYVLAAAEALGEPRGRIKDRLLSRDDDDAIQEDDDGWARCMGHETPAIQAPSARRSPHRSTSPFPHAIATWFGVVDRSKAPESAPVGHPRPWIVGGDGVLDVA